MVSLYTVVHMRIVVPIKQVPQVAALRFDAGRGRAVRADVPLVLNAYDRRALGEAVRLRGERGGSVTVLTMGPPSARDALDECLRLGADQAVHLRDDAFAGADTLATARALAASIGRLGADLVLCGQRSVDAETGVVGPMLAELLGVPFATAVTRVTPIYPEAVGAEGSTRTSAALLHVQRQAPVPGHLDVERLAEVGIETRRLPLPCLLTAAERLHRPEASPATPPAVREAGTSAGQVAASGGSRAAPEHPPIRTWTAADLNLQREQIGAAGSLTRVHRITTRERSRGREIIESASEEAIVRLLSALTSGATCPAASPRDAERVSNAGDAAARISDPTSMRAESRPTDSETRGASLIGPIVVLPDPHRPSAARRLAKLVSEIGAGDGGAVIVLEPSRTQGMASASGVASAPRDHDVIEHSVTAIVTALRAHSPSLILATDGGVGRDALATVAARAGLALVTGIEAIHVDGDGRLLFDRPAWGGGVVASVEALTAPALATVRPETLARFADDAVSSNTPDARSSVAPEATSGLVPPLALDIADTVIGIGTGIGGLDGLAEVEHLARLLGAAIGGTRKVVDLGWLPPQQQIGMSGRQVAPRVYLALGTRGSFNHAVGIRRAGTILAVNPSPRAEIFAECDLGIVADWREVVPALVARLSARRGTRPPGG